jgi:hypothetical protein
MKEMKLDSVLVRGITRRSSGLGGLAPMRVGRFFLVCFVRWVAKSVEAPKPLNAGVLARG